MYQSETLVVKLRPRSDRAGPAQRGGRKRVGEVLGGRGGYGSGMGEWEVTKERSSSIA